jgi:hypothetical protein
MKQAMMSRIEALSASDDGTGVALMMALAMLLALRHNGWLLGHCPLRWTG